MRKVNFPVKERMVLIPVEVVVSIIPALILATTFYFLGGIVLSLAFLSAVFAGIVLFPTLLPYLPTYNFSSKGFFLGAMVAIPFVFIAFMNNEIAVWQKLLYGLSYLLLMSGITAFISLNFTGSTTFTSKYGVKKEILRYFPVMLITVLSGVVLSVTLLVVGIIN